MPLKILIPLAAVFGFAGLVGMVVYLDSTRSMEHLLVQNNELERTDAGAPLATGAGNQASPENAGGSTKAKKPYVEPEAAKVSRDFRQIARSSFEAMEDSQDEAFIDQNIEEKVELRSEMDARASMPFGSQPAPEPRELTDEEKKEVAKRQNLIAYSIARLSGEDGKTEASEDPFDQLKAGDSFADLVGGNSSTLIIDQLADEIAAEEAAAEEGAEKAAKRAEARAAESDLRASMEAAAERMRFGNARREMPANERGSGSGAGISSDGAPPVEVAGTASGSLGRDNPYVASMNEALPGGVMPNAGATLADFNAQLREIGFAGGFSIAGTEVGGFQASVVSDTGNPTGDALPSPDTFQTPEVFTTRPESTGSRANTNREPMPERTFAPERSDIERYIPQISEF